MGYEDDILPYGPSKGLSGPELDEFYRRRADIVNAEFHANSPWLAQRIKEEREKKLK